MNKREVCYLMSGRAHLPYLIVSLHTLRKYWHGHIRVFAWPESIEIVEKMVEMGKGLYDIQVELHEPKYRARRDERRQGKNDQFISKIRLFSSKQMKEEVETVLYLDADTSVHGDLLPLFGAAEKYGFCATRFSSWTTKGKIPQARVGRLKEIEEIDKDCIESVLTCPWPSVNGGVWAASPKSPVFDLWEKWTWAARFQFIADEAVLHTLMPKFVLSGEMVVWPDGRFNCSCNSNWFPEELKEEDIRVFHYHGDSNVRLGKFNGAGVKRWWPMYQECLEQNIGGIRDWGPSIENKWMRELEKEMKR
jgi:hypothetical protein